MILDRYNNHTVALKAHPGMMTIHTDDHWSIYDTHATQLYWDILNSIQLSNCKDHPLYEKVTKIHNAISQCDVSTLLTHGTVKHITHKWFDGFQITMRFNGESVTVLVVKYRAKVSYKIHKMPKSHMKRRESRHTRRTTLLSDQQS